MASLFVGLSERQGSHYRFPRPRWFEAGVRTGLKMLSHSKTMMKLKNAMRWIDASPFPVRLFRPALHMICGIVLWKVWVSELMVGNAASDGQRGNYSGDAWVATYPPPTFLTPEMLDSAWVRNKNSLVRNIDGYGPFPRFVSREECAVMCEATSGCSGAVWTCDGGCSLKQRTPFKLMADAECVDYYRSGSLPEYKELAGLREELMGCFPALPIGLQNVVLIIRCRQNLDWLGALLQSIKERIQARFTVVVYEQCDVTADRQDKIDGVQVWHLGMTYKWTLSLAIISHFITNQKTYEKGKIRSTILVDPDMDFTHAAKLPWARWTVQEYIDFLENTPLPLRVGHGIQHINWDTARNEELQGFDNLRKFGKVMLNGATEAENRKEFGWQSCSARIHVEFKPLTSFSKVAFVLYLSDASFLDMARVLVHTIITKGSKADIVLAVLEKSKDVGERFQAQFPSTKLVVWPYIEPPAKSHEHPRWKDNYSKLNLWAMVEYDAILYVDSDMVALRNPDLFWRHPVIRGSVEPFLAAPDWGFWNRPPSTKLNGGMLFVRPNPYVLNCLLQRLYQTPPEEWDSVEAEQGYLRWFFGDSSTQIPLTFNTQKTVLTSIPEIWNEDQMVFLHFTGVKPFKSWSVPAWLRIYRDPETRNLLAAQDQTDDERDDVEPVTWLWRKSYFGMSNFSEHMSIFVAYHDKESFDSLRSWKALDLDRNLFIPLSLTTPLDTQHNLSTRALYPAVSDPGVQLALGEFAAVIAISQATWYTKPWVGFSTYSEPRKALWREGPSVHWIKVEKQIRNEASTNKLLFWYGIFAGDYWELMDVHHRGMSQVFQHILEIMGYTNVRDVMPRNQFWPFGNYMIMRTDHLRKFATFSQNFLDKFRGTYLNECPFHTMETHTSNWEARCPGYLTERLIHVWTMMEGVNLEYVVDYEDLRYRAGCQAHPVHCRKE